MEQDQQIKEWTRHAKAICIKRIPDHEQEHDWIINGAVWNAISALETFKGDSKVSTWFQTIINNEITDFLRTREGNVTSTIEGLQDELSSSEDLDQTIINREMLRELDCLSEEEKQALELTVEGYSREEVARLTGVTERTAKDRLERAREKLREEIGDQHISNRV
jgi:RNA polymerase sigma-70 factor (ECF subfamily)